MENQFTLNRRTPIGSCSLRKILISVCVSHLCLWGSEGAAEGLLQGVQEGLDLVQALAALALAGAEGHDVEVLEDLLEAGLAHLQGDAAVAEEAAAPDAEHRLTALHAGGRHEPCRPS